MSIFGMTFSYHWLERQLSMNYRENRTVELKCTTWTQNGMFRRWPGGWLEILECVSFKVSGSTTSSVNFGGQVYTELALIGFLYN
jgi:hypothetical protein